MALYQLTQIALLLPFPIYVWSSQTIPLAIYCINPYALKPLPELSPRPNMPYLQTGLPSTHVCISWFTALCSRVSCHPLLTRVYVLICFCHVRLSVTLWTVAPQAPLSMGFFRQRYWSGLLCLPPGALPNPGIEPASLVSPVLAGGFFTDSTTWEAPWNFNHI